jgi:hypothetical protein
MPKYDPDKENAIQSERKSSRNDAYVLVNLVKM